MAYYRVCPNCGCNIDPGEICDCRTEKEEAAPLVRETTSGERTPIAIIAASFAEIKAVPT